LKCQAASHARKVQLNDDDDVDNHHHHHRLRRFTSIYHVSFDKTNMGFHTKKRLGRFAKFSSHLPKLEEDVPQQDNQ